MMPTLSADPSEPSQGEATKRRGWAASSPLPPLPSRHFGEYGQEEGPEPLVGPRPFLRSWINSCRSYGGLIAEGRREIAILMSFPPPLILGSIVADRKPVAPAFAIGAYAAA